VRLQDGKVRGCDSQGCGYFEAPRGNHKHHGVDVECRNYEGIVSSASGVVTKIGFPYGDEDRKHFRYVEVTKDEYRFRYFYINPMVEVGQSVSVDTLLGNSQDLTKIYPGITQHCHFEIMDKDDNYIDPTPVLLALDEPQYG
jgi:murein DD-endopeptidase MepM/ murein hydrolase activator NlpD